MVGAHETVAVVDPTAWDRELGEHPVAVEQVRKWGSGDFVAAGAVAVERPAQLRRNAPVEILDGVVVAVGDRLEDAAHVRAPRSAGTRVLWLVGLCRPVGLRWVAALVLIGLAPPVRELA